MAKRDMRKCEGKKGIRASSSDSFSRIDTFGPAPADFFLLFHCSPVIISYL